MTNTRRLPAPRTEAWDWQLDGSCRNASSAIFFHPEWERGSARRQREATAKAICEHCPVLETCRNHALEAQEPYGVWGGLSESDREEILTRTG
ncbi:WhiB family transcriptional regulator [Amycolatopsis eburnea]|uniref:Transcriptional regulator WhiB n=1 Tax=Amycolatopsis eburnea TaxID=2267691 RepID=A0A3R9FG01_9PSEU|nr:WhiB family transcriptional regulator [Amycolatopsis eburnea]RSD09179.1 WhiB family transcriptional regulator [Amycolatopsis eburnea]